MTHIGGASTPPLPQEQAPTAPFTDSELQSLLMGDFYRSQHYLTFLLSEHLIECRRVIGDLDSVLLLIVLGLAQFEHVKRVQSAERPESNELDRTRPSPFLFTMKATRLSEITGIPRETVRRKLAVLARKGWLTQDAERNWSFVIRDGVTPVRAELEPLTGQMYRRFVKFLLYIFDHHGLGVVPAEAPRP